MIKKRKLSFNFAVCMMGMLLLTGCESVSSERTDKTQKQNSSTEITAMPKEETDTVVASGQSGDYLVEIVLKSGSYVTYELSAYNDTYEGEFEIWVSRDKEVCSTLPFTYDNQTEGINFPRDGEIIMCDYNGDGQDDFAVGQQLGSSAKEYQFYTVTKEGNVQKLEGSIVADDKYFPLFKMKNGEIQYQQYDQDTGKYLEKTFKL